MELIFKFVWVPFIVVTIINGLIFKTRSKKYIAENPELEDGYNKLTKGWIIYGNIPWIIIGIGNLTGMTNSFFEYLHPKSMNPMVLTFHLSIIVLLTLISYWIYLKDGAAFLAKHPGFLTVRGLGQETDITSPLTIKLVWTLALAGGITALTLIWFVNIPTLPVK